jgi:hypothetical protein
MSAYIRKLKTEIKERYEEKLRKGDNKEVLYDIIEAKRKEIFAVAKSVVDDYVDVHGVLNVTALGEYVADELNLYYSGTYDIPEIVFEIVFSVGEKLGFVEF